MKKIFAITIAFFITSLLLQAQLKPKIKLGIEVLQAENFDILKGKKVGLITNPTGVDSKLKSTIDILYKNVNLIALFGPEHGVRGNFEGGTKIKNYIDTLTGLPVYSLYGKNRKPTKRMLQNIDVLVYDIQDIGSRSYTFISTMGLAMEAAAENNIEFVVLDRPNPLGGNIVEGNLVDSNFVSFISRFNIPYIYGLTCGELARLLNNEELLHNGEKCKLKVVPMEGWKREMIFGDTGLIWVPPSPHIPTWQTAFYYAMTGIIGELRNAVSIGVGYTLPFKTFANEWINAVNLSKDLNDLNLTGVKFRRIYYVPYYATGKGKLMRGVQIHITDYSKVELISLQFRIAAELHKLQPQYDLFKLASKNNLSMMDKAMGTDKIRKVLSVNWNYSDIIPLLNKGVKKFKEISKKYYLYN